MTRAIKTTATVQEGGRIQVMATGLRPGSPVEVIILQDEGADRPSIDEILANYPGGRLFNTAEDVRRYLRTERDSWDP
jgi:hypothetical protein